MTDGRLRGRRRGRSGGPTGPVRQRRISSRNSTATSWRTSTCSWSPSWMIVEPRGGIARSPRTITFSSASRGSPSSRTGWPATASSRADRELHRLGAQPVQQHRLDQRRGDRGLVGGHAQPARDRLDRQPLQRRSRAARRRTRPGRSVWPCGMPSVTGKVANTIGVAPRRPAQPSISRSGQREAVGDDQRRQRPRDHAR